MNPQPSKTSPSHGNLLISVILTVAGVVLCSVVAVYVMGQTVLNSNWYISRTQSLIQHLKDTESFLTDAETGQRGFLLTGDELYLAPYVSSKEKIQRQLESLWEFGWIEGFSSREVDQLKALTNAKLKELDETIQLRREKGFEAAVAVVRTDAGKRLMDDFRGLNGRIVDDETRRLDTLRLRADRLTTARTIIFAIVAATNLGFLIWAYRQIRSEFVAREKVTDELRSQKELLGVTLGSIGDGVIVTDANANITFLNDVASKLCGWSATEAMGRPCTEVFNIVNEDTRLRVESPVEKVLRLGTIVGLANHTLLIRRDGSELPIDDSGAPIRDANEEIRGVVLVFRDFSDHKAVTSALIKAREEAEAANIAKDNFLATLSHELRTPLTPVSVMLAGWENNADLPAELRADVQMMRRNVDLEARLIDDLLDLTRIVRGKLSLNLELADLHGLIEGVMSMSNSDFNARELRASTKLTAARHHVRVDPARLQQVLLNVLRNASKFTPANGTIELSTRNDDRGNVEIVIADSGIGMTEDTLSRLFRPFEQGTAETVRRYGGLGLGMAISKALIESQGGTITARSAGLNQGATFVISLPGMTAPLAAMPVAAAPQANAAERQLKILIVEDHEDTARVMTRLLEKQGHRVRQAASVTDAVKVFGQEEFDLLLSDIGLPDGTGMDLIRTIRAQSRIPAIALTGYGMEEDIAKCRDAGFDDHLTKPVNLQRLQSAITLVVQRSK